MPMLEGRTARVMNGAGNKITVLDLRGSPARVSAHEARALGAHEATHFDQLMVLADPRAGGTLARISIYNVDGSMSGACGNGMRCVGWHLFEADGIAADEILTETDAGLLSVRRDAPTTFTVDMGTPKFGWKDVPLSEPFAETRHIELAVGPIGDPVMDSPSVLSMGNPHAVFFVEDVNAIQLDRIGPVLEHHPYFPEGANISVAQVIDRETIVLKVWERGAGLTLACGSAACATLIAANRRRRTGRKAVLHLPGGALGVEWRESDDHVLLTGPVVFERDVVLDAAMLGDTA